MRPFVFAAALAILAPAAQAADVIVFAAASLKTALDRIAADWSAGTEAKVAISYAGSSVLARQIELGAPADIFISASTAWMDSVQAAGMLEDGSRRDLLGNRLVLIGPAPAESAEIGPGLDLAARLGGGRLAMALLDSVPAGLYGKAALTSLGLWNAVANSVAQADNVRAALALVASGEAPLGIVYATDAAAEPRVTVIGTFPEESHPPIVYPAARIAGRDAPEAEAFFAALLAPAARTIWQAEGFSVLTP